jgi:hypothetical protein
MKGGSPYKRALGAKQRTILGPYTTFHFKYHIECSMVTWYSYLRMFPKSKFYYFMLNIEFCLAGDKGKWTVFNFHLSVVPSLTGSCNIFNFLFLSILDKQKFSL